MNLILLSRVGHLFRDWRAFRNSRGRALRGRVNLTEGSVGGHLASLGVFLGLGVLAIMGTSLVDIYFVAQLGAHELAAISFTVPVMMIMSAFSLGLGNGVIAVVARAVGQGDHGRVRLLATDSIFLALLIVLVLVVIGYATIEPLFTLLGAEPDVLPLIEQYMHIWYMGAAFQIVQQSG